MSTIQLENVTKIYTGPMSARRTANPLHTGGQSDHAFAERVAAQSDLARHAVKGPVAALDGVNLTIPDGQTFAIVGPSGCGKSTLLRVVAGLEPEYTGRVLYDEQDMRDTPPKNRYIGMVFQSYALYPHFVGRDNLAFSFMVRKAPDEETEERIRITSDIMGIGFRELLKRKPGALSGGQQQRVAIARAIVRQPRLFLFDEPLSNLDAKLRTQTRVEIKRLLRRFGITAIYVTHDQVEATTLGDQIAVMRAGRVEQVGTFHELRQAPANGFVAGFLGSPPMNLLAGGTVGDGQLYLQGIAIPLPDEIKARVHTGQAITLGIRPKAAHALTGTSSPPDGIHLRGVAETIEPDFAHRAQMVYTRTGSLFYAATGPLDTSLNVGDEIEIVLPTGQLYFFDTESGRRIG